MKSTGRLLGHSLPRSHVRSHCSLINLLRTARFARLLPSAHSFARLFTRLLRSSWERSPCLWSERLDFIQFQLTVDWGNGVESMDCGLLEWNGDWFEWKGGMGRGILIKEMKKKWIERIDWVNELTEWIEEIDWGSGSKEWIDGIENRSRKLKAWSREREIGKEDNKI